MVRIFFSGVVQSIVIYAMSTGSFEPGYVFSRNRLKKIAF